MKEETLNRERTTEEFLIDAVNELVESEKHCLESNDVVATRLYYLDEFSEKLKKLMFEEFHARFKCIKELYDLNAYGISINEIIVLGKRLEGYYDEMKKIETEILSLIDDEIEDEDEI